MSDSLPPMTDEVLAAIEGRLAASPCGPLEVHDRNPDGALGSLWSIENAQYRDPDGHTAEESKLAFGAFVEFGSKTNAEMLAAAPTDLRRLLDEVKRLNREFADFRQMAVLNSKAATEAVDRARSECAALAAKVERMRVERDRAIGECDDWETKYAELSVERDSLRRAMNTPGMPHTPAQEAQERPETREGDTDTGTGGRDAHGRTEAIERGRQVAVSMMDRAEAKYRHQHGQPHPREHCETCAEEYWTERLRPGHYREAAGNLRAYVAAQPPIAPDNPHACGLRDGIITAAERLESYARDLEEADR